MWQRWPRACMRPKRAHIRQWHCRACMRLKRVRLLQWRCRSTLLPLVLVLVLLVPALEPQSGRTAQRRAAGNPHRCPRLASRTQKPGVLPPLLTREYLLGLFQCMLVLGATKRRVRSWEEAGGCRALPRPPMSALSRLRMSALRLPRMSLQRLERASSSRGRAKKLCAVSASGKRTSG